MDDITPRSRGQGKRIDGLTQKQFGFVVAYVKSGNGPGAYREAYETKAKPATSEGEVKKLLKKPEIIEAIRSMRADLRERAEITVADVIKELWDNAMKAKEAEPIVDKKGDVVGYTAQLQASNAALIAVGKHLGAFEPKPADLREDLIGQLSAEQRKALREAAERERERRAAAATARSVEPDGPGTHRTIQ